MFCTVVEKLKNKFNDFFSKVVQQTLDIFKKSKNQDNNSENKPEREGSFEFKKEIYIQTQSWARHNETLIIATNTLLLGAVAAIWPSLYEKANSLSIDTLFLPLVVSAIGMCITFTLSRQYHAAITRVVVYEWYFGLHDRKEESFCKDIIQYCGKKTSKKWGNSFVPEYLNSPPRFGSDTSKCFMIIHFLIFIVCGNLILNDRLELIKNINLLINKLNNL